MDESPDDEPKKNHVLPIVLLTDEEDYRTQYYQDHENVLGDSLLCTLCEVDLSPRVSAGESVECHPHLGVLLCKDCMEFYGLGEFSADEDGSDKYCRWCAQGGKLFCCSKCVCAFCRKCLKRNISKKDFKNLENEDDWLCLMCNPKPIFKKRAICANSINHIRQLKCKRNSKRKVKLEKMSARKLDKEIKSQQLQKRASKDKVKRGMSESAKTCSVIELSDDDSSGVSVQVRKSSRTTSAVCRPKLQQMSSFDFSDSDFEPRRSQRPNTKVKLEGKYSHPSKTVYSDVEEITESSDGGGSSVLSKNHHLDLKVEQSTQNMSSKVSNSDVKLKHSQKMNKKSKKDTEDKNESNINIEQVKSSQRTGDKQKSKAVSELKVERQHVVLDGLVDDIDCIGRMLIDRTQQFRKKYFSNQEGPKHMMSFVQKKMKRLVEVSTQSLSHVMKDLIQLENTVGSDNSKVDSSDIENSGPEKSMAVKQSSSEHRNLAEFPKSDPSDAESSGPEKSIAVEQSASEDQKFIGNVNSKCDSSDGENSGPEESMVVEQSSRLDVKREDSVLNSCGDVEMGRRCGSMTSDDDSVHAVDEDIHGNITSPNSNYPSSSGTRFQGNAEDFSKDSSSKSNTKALEVDNLTRNAGETDHLGKSIYSDETINFQGNETDDSSNDFPTKSDSKASKSSTEIKNTDKTDILDKEVSVQSNETILNQSVDLFSEHDMSVDFNSINHKICDDKNSASVALSSRSLDMKLKLLAPSDSESGSDICSKPVKVRKNKEDLIPLSSPSACGLSCSDKVVHMKTEEMLSKYKDLKLRSASKVVIEKMDKSLEQKYFDLLGDYYKSDTSNSDSDNSISRLINLSNLKRRAKYSSKEDPVHCKNVSRKSKEKEKKVTLSDFYGGSDADVDEESEVEEDQPEIKSKVDKEKPNRNELYKAMLLMSSGSEDDMAGSDKENCPGTKSAALCSDKDESQLHSNVHPDVNSVNDLNDSTEKRDNKKSSWRQDKLLTQKLSDSDTSDDERRWSAKKLKGEDSSDKKLERSGSPRKSVKIKKSDKSDSDMSCQNIDSSSSDDFVKLRQKRPLKKSSSSSSSSESCKPKTKKIRRRIKVMNSSSSDDSSDAKVEMDSPNKGRKKIRRVLKDNDLEEDTKVAAKEEEERRKRIAERNKKFNESYENLQKKCQTLDKLILDYDETTKEPLVEVHRELVKNLKPHQAEGVRFMWDASFESIERINKSNGSGCILAHCMGLGKTLQVITLLHTLFMHPKTKVHTALIVCPLSTVLNWVNEFDKWLGNIHDGRQISVFELTRQKKNYERQYKLQEWQEEGGVLVIGYEMYRNLCNPESKRVRASILKTFQTALVDPGPDIVVCDEGHLLKNEETAISKAMSRVKTLRRVVLTGTPLQNNLKEYHCMVQFVKPNLLGTRKEFLNRFVNPITNGQFEDSTSHDVRTMKRRAHVLHKTLEGSVQRYDYSVLTPFLPVKQEFVISVRLTELQESLYKHYLENFSSKGLQGRGAQLFNDFQQFQRIWTHPRVLKMSAERNEIKAEKKRQDEDSEGSLRDFIDDGDDSSSSSSSGTSSDDVKCLDDDKEERKGPIRRLRSNKNTFEDPEPVVLPEEPLKKEWWRSFVNDEDFEDLKASPKLLLLFSILRECEEMGDKLLVFSQSLFSLDLIEYFLNKIDEATQNGSLDESLNEVKGSWSRGIDYFRLDGQTPTDIRSLWCKSFNNASNSRGRLFLISTRAGGLGINLVAANRVIIFDASWNPSHDVQSIFRIYRFGQKKPCFIYRFLAQGTMEEKIYERQVTKLSLACRVVDEQQIERHYNMADLQELYMFTPADRFAREKPKLPKDGVFAEILKAHEDIIISYHEHDSLLENKEDEELNEEERQAAWEEYENEKKGRAIPQVGFGTDSIPTADQLRELFMQKDPSLTEEDLQNRVSSVMNQIIAARLQQQQQQQMEQFRQQQQLRYQQTKAQYQEQQHYRQLQQLRLRQFAATRQQPMQYQHNPGRFTMGNEQYPSANFVPMPNPAFQPYEPAPSTSFGSSGNQNSLN